MGQSRWPVSMLLILGNGDNDGLHDSHGWWTEVRVLASLPFFFISPRFLLFAVSFCSSSQISRWDFLGGARLWVLGLAPSLGLGLGLGSWDLVLGFLVRGSRISDVLRPVAGCFTSSMIDPDIPADLAVIVSQIRGPVSTASARARDRAVLEYRTYSMYLSIGFGWGPSK